jgi:hypothetical protein
LQNLAYVVRIMSCYFYPSFDLVSVSLSSDQTLLIRGYFLLVFKDWSDCFKKVIQVVIQTVFLSRNILPCDSHTKHMQPITNKNQEGKFFLLKRKKMTFYRKNWSRQSILISKYNENILLFFPNQLWQIYPKPEIAITGHTIRLLKNL